MSTKQPDEMALLHRADKNIMIVQQEGRAVAGKHRVFAGHLYRKLAHSPQAMQ